jgi:hydrogenase maturation factor
VSTAAPGARGRSQAAGGAHEPHAHGDSCHPSSGCITCGDTASPLRVKAVDAERGLALCRNAMGGTESVEIALVLPVEPGDVLLVHAGTAIGHLTREGLA